MIDLENIVYEIASLQQAVSQAHSLMEKHFKEAEHSFPDKSLKLDLDVLTILEQNDNLLIVVAKDKSIDKVVGYAAFMIDNTVVTDAKIANELGLYVAQEYRNLGIGGALLSVAEVFLRNKQVTLIKMVLKDKNQGMHSEIYDLGYELEELVFCKRI